MIANVCGTDVYYEQTGSGSENVLLLHGWGCNATFFQPLTAALQSKCHVTVLDFPGFGKSGKPPVPWDVKNYADAVYQLLQLLHINKTCVVGHSFGCRVILKLCQIHPELFDKIIITGGAGIKPVPSEKQKRRSNLFRRLKNIVLFSKKIKVFGFLPDLWLERLRKKFGSADYNALDEEMRKTFVKVISEDLSPALTMVKAPCLLVWGENDTETPLSMGKQMEKQIPDAGLVVFEGAGHFAFLEQKDRFNVIAQHFLSEE